MLTAIPTQAWSINNDDTTTILSANELQLLATPISMYDFLVALHYYGMWPSIPSYVSSTLPGVQEYAHGAALLPWHRRITWEFEKLAQQVIGDPTWSMPYWDGSAYVCSHLLSFALIILFQFSFGHINNMIMILIYFSIIIVNGQVIRIQIQC
jgi:hypothetical protein